jgi:hypothetical protein
MMAGAHDMKPYLEKLKTLPFVIGVRAERAKSSRKVRELDALIVLDTPAGSTRLPTELKHSHLTRELAERLLHVGADVPGLLVLAPVVGRDLGELFSAARINFMDLAGNCHVRIGDRYIARMQGFRAEARPSADKGLRAGAYRVLFALLAAPKLSGAPGRQLAAQAGGVSPQTATSLRARLVDSGILLRARGTHLWAPGGRKAALDLFTLGFATTLHPSLTLGRFRAKEREPLRLEVEIGKKLAHVAEWRWGGGAACQRLTHHFRGDRTTVYVEHGDRSLGTKLGLIQDNAGPVTLSLSPGPLAFVSPHQQTVHPLLAYFDLLMEGDERAREAAADLFDRYLLKPVDDSP